MFISKAHYTILAQNKLSYMLLIWMESGNDKNEIVSNEILNTEINKYLLLINENSNFIGILLNFC